MVQLFIEEAGTYARDVDNLITLIAVVVGFWFFLAEGVLFYLIFKYKAKDGQKSAYIAGDSAEEKRPITIAHSLVLLCDIVLIVGAINVWVKVKQTLPEPDSTIRITAQQWAWTFQHPGPDNVLDTDDDIVTIDELHVQTDTVYHFKLTATDVVHSFSVPAFRLKQDAIPGRTITGWFEPNKTGTYDIQCAEICGIGHGLMAARLVIESREDHAAWITEHTPSLASATPAASGAL